MTTLNELKSQLAELDRLLYATWLQEREQARRRVSELAVEFQLSPATVSRDIEAAMRQAEPPVPALRPPKVEVPLRRPGTALHIEIKYRNPATGDYWKGRGPKPRWLREALDAGALLDDFLVQSVPDMEPTDPLREFQNTARRALVATRG
jgi:DNA-binding protein H-NS